MSGLMLQSQHLLIFSWPFMPLSQALPFQKVLAQKLLDLEKVVENPLAKHWKASEAGGCCPAGSSGKQAQKKERKPTWHPEQIHCFWTRRWEPGTPQKSEARAANMLSAKAAFTKTCTSAAPRA